MAKKSVTEIDYGSLALRMVNTSGGMMNRIGATLAEMNLTQTTAAALWATDDTDHGTPLKELSVSLGCDRSNATLIAGKLESSGLAERATAPGDRRVRVLRLTNAGRRARRALLSAIGSASGLEQLSPTERDELARLLDKLAVTSAGAARAPARAPAPASPQ